MKLRLISVFILYLALSGFNFVFAQTDQIAGEPLEIHFFYSSTCPHCVAEQKFLDKIEQKYPDIAVNRYLPDSKNRELLQKFAKEYGVERYLGIVPLTFVGEDFFVGFDNDEGAGKNIENSIKKQLNNTSPSSGSAQEPGILNLPFIGELDAGKYSLPAVAVLAGFLDGFNVCSLGALVLILGLVLALRSRKKILFFGGIYILTAAIVYGFLIMLWYQLFTFLAPYIKITEFIIVAIAIGGGVYFLKEYLKFRKYGPACETTGGNIVKKSIKKLQDSFRGAGNILFLGGSVLLFAAVITIVEFPCSAAIPVIFAGILAKAQLSSFAYFLYMAIFLLFYMLDELIVFLIAVWKMNIWISSPKFTTWAVLIEAILLFVLGFYYFIGIF